MAFGEILTNLRKSKGLSQEQLASELSLTRQTISKWELNQSTPDIDYLVRLSDFFCVTTDYLLKGEERSSIADEDKADTEAKEIIYAKAEPRGVNTNKWCVIFGSAVMGTSLIGIIAFVICSALKPWTVMADNKVFTGLAGFLMGSKTTQFFNILVVLCIAGFIISAFGIIKEMLRRR